MQLVDYPQVLVDRALSAANLELRQRLEQVVGRFEEQEAELCQVHEERDKELWDREVAMAVMNAWTHDVQELQTRLRQKMEQSAAVRLMEAWVNGLGQGVSGVEGEQVQWLMQEIQKVCGARELVAKRWD